MADPGGVGGGAAPSPGLKMSLKKMVTLIFTLKREEDGPPPLAKKGEGVGVLSKTKNRAPYTHKQKIRAHY